MTHFEERVPHDSGFSFPLDSELKPLFDYHVLKMHNLGLINKVLFDHLDDSKPEDKTNSLFYDDVPEVAFEGLYFPISIIAPGVLFSVFVVCFEHAITKSKAFLFLKNLLKSHS